MLIAFSIIVLLLGAVTCLIFWNHSQVQRAIALGSVFCFFGLSIALFLEVSRQGAVAIQMGNWPAPFGITLVVDLLSATMVVVTAIIGLASLLYAMEDIEPFRISKGFYPVFLFLLFGVTGSFIAGDIFNLYVWYEVMLVSSFVLISLGNTKSQLEGSVKYVILNFIASGFFLTGVGVLYNATGTLNLAHIAQQVEVHSSSPLITISAIMFLIAFGIKSAVFPLFAWLPASYHTPPVSISGLMAGLLTKVGVYSFLRVFTMVFMHDFSFLQDVLLVIAGLTMITGVLGAMAQGEFRRILSFHIVSQIGYMLMGLAIFTPLALAGSVFYIVHHIMVKTNLFFISGLVKWTSGHFILKRLGGVYERYPLITVVFVISAFSLAGIPPLSGFWGKFILIKAGIEAGYLTIAIVALIVGVLTLFSMIKIWNQVFWASAPEDTSGEGMTESRNQGTLLRTKFLMVLPVILLTGITLFISFNPDFLISLAMDISNQLLDPKEYIHAVFNQ